MTRALTAIDRGIEKRVFPTVCNADLLLIGPAAFHRSPSSSMDTSSNWQKFRGTCDLSINDKFAGRKSDNDFVSVV